VLPAIFFLLAGAIVAPGRSSAGAREPADAAPRTGSAGRLPWSRTTLLRGAAALVGIVAIFAIVSPLATSTALSRSQTAAADGNVPAALADAREAVSLEPGTAAPQLQLALVLELAHAYPQALVAARQAVRDESQNWSNWLTLSRLEAESGHADAAVSAYLTAKRLNPQSPLFRDSHATA
jgi:tetratricopeptide (TPR) repeat protein